MLLLGYASLKSTHLPKKFNLVHRTTFPYARGWELDISSGVFLEGMALRIAFPSHGTSIRTCV